MTAITLLMVCVPEGMPLAVSIALAFSVDRMKEDGLLLKELGALETAGSLQTIFTGKTGTLTQADFKVENVFYGTQTAKPLSADHPDISEAALPTIKDLIIMNTSARMEINDKTNEFVPRGNPIEVAFLNFLTLNEENVQTRLSMKAENSENKLFIPFDPARRRMTVAYTIDGYPDTVRLVVKGASDIILPLCTHVLDEENNQVPFVQDDNDYLSLEQL